MFVCGMDTQANLVLAKIRRVSHNEWYIIDVIIHRDIDKNKYFVDAFWYCKWYAVFQRFKGMGYLGFLHGTSSAGCIGRLYLNFCKSLNLGASIRWYLPLIVPTNHVIPQQIMIGHYWKHNSDLMKPVKRPLFQKDLDLVTPLDLVPMYLISYA